MSVRLDHAAYHERTSSERCEEAGAVCVSSHVNNFRQLLVCQALCSTSIPDESSPTLRIGARAPGVP